MAVFFIFEKAKKLPLLMKVVVLSSVLTRPIPKVLISDNMKIKHVQVYAHHSKRDKQRKITLLPKTVRK